MIRMYDLLQEFFRVQCDGRSVIDCLAIFKDKEFFRGTDLPTLADNFLVFWGFRLKLLSRAGASMTDLILPFKNQNQ